MRNETLQDFIDGRLIEAIFADPETIFGGDWKRRGSRMVCSSHILTDGHHSHDGNGAFISTSRQHLLCDGSDPHTNIEVVKYVEQARGFNRMEAAQYIATAYGITFPNLTEETPEARQRREHRAKQRRTAETMKFADTPTLTDGQNEALDYLHGRGLSDKQIAAAGIVYVSSDPAETEAYAKLGEIWQIIVDRVKEDSRPGGVWPTKTLKAVYRLAWPVWSSGRLSGYVFAVLPSDRAEAEAQGRPKYKLARFDDTPAVVFDLKPACPKRKPWLLSTLVAVEGYFDAWTAAHALSDTQTPDVIAYINGAISPDQAAAIHRAGYDRVVFVPDWEGQTETRTIEAGARLQANHIESSCTALRRAGVVTYIANLRDDKTPQTKQDANSYIQAYGEDAFRETIADALTVAMYSVYTAPYQYGGDLAAMETADTRAYIRRVIAEEEDPIAYRRLLSDNVVKILYDGDLKAAAADIKAEREKVIKEREKEAAATRRQLHAEAYEQAARFIADGDDKAAAQVIRRAEATDGPDIMATTFAPQSLTAFDKETPDIVGIPTPYYLHNSKGDNVKLTIKGEAITTIGARSGHGKTTVLLNLAVCCLDKIGDDEVVVYFTAETSRKTLGKRLSSIMAGRKRIGVTVAASAIDKALETGKLAIFRDRDAKVISDRVEALGSKKRVRAVIIDYIQLLRVAGFRGNKKERMEETCSILEAMAVTSSAAVIIGAQLNRAETKDPVSWGVDSIGDAIDIEQVSSDIFLVWNTAKMITGDKDIGSVNGELHEAHIDATVGVPGKLIVKCIKARDEQLGNGGNAVWIFNEDCSISQRPAEAYQTDAF